MGRNKGLKGDGAGMDIRVFPPKARDSRFERSMGDALRQQNEELEMQEVSSRGLLLKMFSTTLSKTAFNMSATQCCINRTKVAHGVRHVFEVVVK